MTEEIEVDPRCHSRLIGQKGRNIRQKMDKYSVDIRFPSDKTSRLVKITGAPENVEDCRDDLLLAIEEYVSPARRRRWFLFDRYFHIGVALLASGSFVMWCMLVLWSIVWHTHCCFDSFPLCKLCVCICLFLFETDAGD